MQNENIIADSTAQHSTAQHSTAQHSTAQHSKHIVLYKGRIATLDNKIDRFIDYLNENQIDYYVVNTNNPESYNGKAFDDFVLQPGCVMFTYNDVGINTSVNGINLWKALNIPVYTYLVDHPRYYYDELLEPKCRLYVICCDRDHVDFCRMFYDKLSDVFFVPQGGKEVNSTVLIQDRKVDVIYMGSCKEDITDFPVIPFIADFVKDFYSFCIEKLFSNPKLTTESVIKEFFSERNIELTQNELFELYTTTSHNIEKYVRRRFQLWAVHALDDAGVHVDIYGDRWEDKDNPFSDNIVIHERIPLKELLHKTGEAKISLCFIPWFKRGCSEKNFDSMINGALCVTDESEYLKERYKDGYNIVYFDLNNPEQMAADVKWLLDNPAELEKIAARGYQTAREFDSWNKRYEYIYSLMCKNL